MASGTSGRGGRAACQSETRVAIYVVRRGAISRGSRQASTRRPACAMSATRGPRFPQWTIERDAGASTAACVARSRTASGAPLMAAAPPRRPGEPSPSSPGWVEGVAADLGYCWSTRWRSVPARSAAAATPSPSGRRLGSRPCADVVAKPATVSSGSSSAARVTVPAATVEIHHVDHSSCGAVQMRRTTMEFP
jgi:hypothetical protein